MLYTEVGHLFDSHCISGCGDDNICRSDLAITAETAPFVIGSVEFITLAFTVMNLRGDPAFKPQLKIPVPEIVTVRKTAKECSEVVRLMQMFQVCPMQMNQN